MLNTALSILAAIALLMPGFIVAELSVVRSVRPPRSDMELALRALAYTLILHLIFGLWTARLIEAIGAPEHWPDHVGAISLYVAAVLLGVPISIGVSLNRYLATVEARGGLTRWSGTARSTHGWSAACTANAPQWVKRRPLTTSS